ncbi:hypothetical protein EMCRGX_G029589 [Ephydatia muelleri]
MIRHRITFEEVRDAEDALHYLDGYKLHGRELEIHYAEGDRKTPNQMKTKERGGGGGSNRRRYNSGSPSPRRRGRSYSRSPSPRRRRRPSHSRSPSPRRRKSYSRSPSPRPRRKHSRSLTPKRDTSPQPNERSRPTQDARGPSKSNVADGALTPPHTAEYSRSPAHP